MSSAVSVITGCMQPHSSAGFNTSASLHPERCRNYLGNALGYHYKEQQRLRRETLGNFGTECLVFAVIGCSGVGLVGWFVFKNKLFQNLLVYMNIARTQKRAVSI